jgi:hypothetical protein
MPLAAGFGNAVSSQPSKSRLNRFQSSRASNLCGASILVRHHQRDGGLRVVHVQRAASGDEFHQPGGAVVVADIECNRDRGTSCTSRTWASADDSETGNPNDIPKATKDMSEKPNYCGILEGIDF